MEERLAANNDDDRPTLPYPEVATLPRAIPVLAPPGFDLAVATPMQLDGETLRFLAVGDARAAAETEAENDDSSAWWTAQRQRTLRGLVATVMAVCAAVLAAGVR